MLQNFTYYAQLMFHMLSIILYKFKVLFLLSNLNYKIMSISSLYSYLQSSTQLTFHLCMYINTLNSFLLHLQLYLVHILTKSLPPIHPNLTIAMHFIQFFINCTGNVCLLCWHYAQYFCFPIMLKIMLV